MACDRDRGKAGLAWVGDAVSGERDCRRRGENRRGRIVPIRVHGAAPAGRTCGTRERPRHGGARRAGACDLGGEGLHGAELHICGRRDDDHRDVAGDRDGRTRACGGVGQARCLNRHRRSLRQDLRGDIQAGCGNRANGRGTAKNSVDGPAHGCVRRVGDHRGELQRSPQRNVRASGRYRHSDFGWGWRRLDGSGYSCTSGYEREDKSNRHCPNAGDDSCNLASASCERKESLHHIFAKSKGRSTSVRARVRGTRETYRDFEPGSFAATISKQSIYRRAS